MDLQQQSQPLLYFISQVNLKLDFMKIYPLNTGDFKLDGGAMFGVVRGVIFLLALSVVVHMTALHESELWTDSKGAPMLMTLLKGIKPMLPEKFGAYLPD